MKNPLDYVFDWYDYQYQYYRWYLHRRVLFSELSAENLKQEIKYNIFEHKDYENVDKLVKQSTLIGLSAGLGIAPIKYIMTKDLRKQPAKLAFTNSLGVFAFCAGAGLVYGGLVNAISIFRGEKDDPKNHALAALATFSGTGVFAKTEKYKWGALNGILFAGIAAFMKYAYTRKDANLEKHQKKLFSSFDPTRYRPTA